MYACIYVIQIFSVEGPEVVQEVLADLKRHNTTLWMVSNKKQFREAMAGLVPKEELTEWRNKSGGAFEIQVRGRPYIT